MIKIVNEAGNDLSQEMILNSAVMFSFIEGAARMCNITLRKAEAQGYKVALLRDNKRAFNEALRMAKQLRYQLNNAFDGMFDKIYQNDGDRCDAMGELGIAMVKVGIAYLSRIDKDPRNQEQILKNILDYEGVDINVEELLKMYDIK